MNLIMITKRNKFLIVLVTVLVTGTLLFSGCTEQREEPTPELLGEAQIVVYGKSEEIAIDSKSPYFGELQLACEEMLISGKTFWAETKTLPDLEEVKNQEWAVELTYSELIIVTIPRLAGSTDVGVGGFQLIIPLTGRLTHLESVLKDKEPDNKYTHIFLLPEEMDFPSQIIDGIAELVGTKKDVQKIKDILTRLDINVPY
jgi:hypothetical protein